MKYQFGYGSVTRNCRSRSARPGAYTARKRYGRSACPSRIARTEMPVDLIAGEGATNRQREDGADGQLASSGAEALLAGQVRRRVMVEQQVAVEHIARMEDVLDHHVAAAGALNLNVVNAKRGQDWLSVPSDERFIGNPATGVIH